jgi:hypothetical protein
MIKVKQLKRACLFLYGGDGKGKKAEGCNLPGFRGYLKSK